MANVIKHAGLWGRAAMSIAAFALVASCSASDPMGPVSALHHFKTGNAAYKIEDFAGAVAHFKMALELDEGSAEINYNLGLAYYRSGNYKQAVPAFNAALALQPDLPEAHYNLALAYDRLFQPQSAHAHYNRYRAMVSEEKSKRGNALDGANDPTARSSKAIPAALAGITASPAGRGTGSTAGGALPAASRGGPAQLGQSPKRAGGMRQARRARPGARKMVAGNPRSGAAPRNHSSQESTGDSRKWWIQDRFIQNQ